MEITKSKSFLLLSVPFAGDTYDAVVTRAKAKLANGSGKKFIIAEAVEVVELPQPDPIVRQFIVSDAVGAKP